MNSFQLGIESITDKEEVRALVKVREAHKEVENQILDVLTLSGALLKGHFVLESQLHSSYLARLDYALGMRGFGDFVAERLIKDLRRDRVVFDALLCQEHAGYYLAETIAAKLGKRTIVVETDERNIPTEKLINESALYPHDRVVLVVDLLATGSGLHKMAEVVRKRKAIPVAVALFATRNQKAASEFERSENLKIYALVDLAFEDKTFEAGSGQCPGCAQGQPTLASWEM